MFAQVKNDVGRMGRGGRKLALLLAALAVLLVLAYKLQLCSLQDNGPVMVAKRVRNQQFICVIKQNSL